MNDQAETLLMNLLRGAGAKGLAAMSVKRRLSAGVEVDLVRPLLTWATRGMTEDYCRVAEISYRIDVMNEDARFTRVKIRKELLPQLEEFNPNIINVLCQTGSNIADMHGAFEYLLNKNPGITAMIGNGYLSVSDLVRCPAELKRAVVKAWLHKQIGSARRISAVHIRSVVLLSESKKSGKTVELPNGMSVIKSGGKLKLHKALVEKTHTEDYN
jgi:tRNA(Ile)-lysidine synthase